MQIAIEITEEDYNRIKDIPLSRFVSPISLDVLEYLETAYTGARACDDVAEQVRLARAIEAYKHDVHEDWTNEAEEHMSMIGYEQGFYDGYLQAQYDNMPEDVKKALDKLEFTLLVKKEVE